MRRIAFRWVGTVAAVFAVAAAGVQAQEKVDYKRKLLAHLDANQPVAGTFEIRTEIDAEQSKLLIPPPPPGAKPGIVARPEPADQLLKCRWAWATGREVCESLPGSTNSQYGLLMLPQGTLVGYNESQFNLYKQEVQGAGFVRPALFYFVSGGNRSWADLLRTLDLKKAEAQPDLGEVVAEGVEDGMTYTFVLDEKASHLKRASAHRNGKLSWQLVIADYARSLTDGRVFPRSAVIRVFAFADKPIRTMILTANDVVFPTPNEALPLFNLPIPGRALIGDRVQNKAIVLKEPTDGVTILTGDVPRTPFTDPGPK